MLPSSSSRRDVSYDSARREKKLDVYRAQHPADGKDELQQPISLSDAFQKVAQTPITIHDHPSSLTEATASLASRAANSARSSPIIIFIPSPHLGPLTPSKWMFESLGRNLAALGYTVVIPNVTKYPDGKAKEMVGDVRKVMRWAERHGREWGGDPERIWLAGHRYGNISLLDAHESPS